MTMQPSRIFDILSILVHQHPLERCLSDKINGVWMPLSTEKFFESANYVSAALLALGVKPQDKISLISTNNRSEWSIVDMAILQIGAISVPLYPNISSKDYKYILNHSESIYCFVSDQDLYEKVVSVKKEVKGLKEIYCFDEIENCKNWSELYELGKEERNEKKLNKTKAIVEASDLATIIYTSGTTGTPKGVMLSHNNCLLYTSDAADE